MTCIKQINEVAVVRFNDATIHFRSGTGERDRTMRVGIQTGKYTGLPPVPQAHFQWEAPFSGGNLRADECREFADLLLKVADTLEGSL